MRFLAISGCYNIIYLVTTPPIEYDTNMNGLSPIPAYFKSLNIYFIYSKYFITYLYNLSANCPKSVSGILNSKCSYSSLLDSYLTNMSRGFSLVYSFFNRYAGQSLSCFLLIHQVRNGCESYPYTNTISKATGFIG